MARIPPPSKIFRVILLNIWLPQRERWWHRQTMIVIIERDDDRQKGDIDSKPEAKRVSHSLNSRLVTAAIAALILSINFQMKF
jgi:hypothetical protein